MRLPADVNAEEILSVVIPCRNDARFLPACIESILGQSYPFVECIVVDGASTDGTREILESYGKRIRWSSEPDGGPADAIEKGWRAARGGVLAWLNADDLWAMPDAAATAMRFLKQHPDVDLVYGRCGQIDEQGALVGMSYSHPWDLAYSVTTSDHCIPQPAAMLRRRAFERIGGVPRTTYLDRALYLQIALHGRVEFIPEVLAQARTRQGVSADGDRMSRSLVETMQSVLESEDLPREIRDQRRRALSNAYLRATDYAFSGGRHWPRIAEYAVHAVLADPTNVRAAVGRMKKYVGAGAKERIKRGGLGHGLRSLAKPVTSLMELASGGNPLTPTLPRNLAGDRDVEWSFCLAQLPPHALTGQLLEVGAGHNPTPLVAARRGYTVTAVDLAPIVRHVTEPRLRCVTGDIRVLPLGTEQFDVIVCCSTIEHVGLPGRYGVNQGEPDGDLDAMRRIRAMMKRDAVMLLTIPVGLDAVHGPFCRVYGAERLPLLLSGFGIDYAEYWVKDEGNRWVPADRSVALSAVTDAASSDPLRCIYGLGCFRLRRST